MPNPNGKAAANTRAALERDLATGVQQVHVTFRCPTPMSVGLRRQALIQGVDVAVLLRQAVTEWAERYGVNITTI